VNGTSVDDALSRLLERYVGLHRAAHGRPPRQPFDPAWPSPCQLGDADRDGFIEWLPVRRDIRADFTDLERALEQRLHPDLAVFLGTYYADVIEGRTAEGGVHLVQVWNDADFDRLVENLLGHALGKFRRREPLTVFFATTDEDECFLSVDNESGAVLLEIPGHPPIREVAAELAAFLDRVEPVLSTDPDDIRP